MPVLTLDSALLYRLAQGAASAADSLTMSQLLGNPNASSKGLLFSSAADPSPGTPAPPPAISVPVAIVLGLIASFIQSLGIALQRGSHLQNDALPPAQRRAELRRPRWLLGFAIFMLGTISTVLQIGALPIVILAPLGAVSLLYNAVLARFLLNTTFSKFMVAGTALITIGAVLIALFGAITESPHSLDELLRLFARPPFVACCTVLLFVLFCVLFCAHLAEWQLHIRIFRINLGPDYWRKRTGSSGFRGLGGKKRKSKGMRRRWSAPTLAPLAEVNENASGIATPAIASADEAARRAAGHKTYSGNPSHVAGRVRVNQQNYGATGSLLPPIQSPTSGRRTGSGSGSNGVPAGQTSSTSTDASQSNGSAANGTPPPAASKGMTPSPSNLSTSSTSSSSSSTSTNSDGANSAKSAAAPSLADLDPGIRRTKTILAVAYAGASGTLSGACLLLAKSGIELVLLSLTGADNQFGRWQSWALVGVMLAAALLQLWYLNKALRFESPVLVMPLAFCFYNTASIALGLVYFDQLGTLAWWNILLVILGTIILLMGVWVVSLHTEQEVEEEEQLHLALEFCVSPTATGGDLPLTDEDDAVMDERQPLLAPVVPKITATAPDSAPTTPTKPNARARTGSDPALVTVAPSPPGVSPPGSMGHVARRRAQSLATGIPDGTGATSIPLLSPTKFHFTRRARPERRAVHFLSRSASLSLGLGFAPAMQEEEDGEGVEGEEGDESAVLVEGGVSVDGEGGAAGAAEGSQVDLEAARRGTVSESAGHGHARDGSGEPPQLSYSSFFKRGLSIGIGVGSPGFYVQPTGIRSTPATSAAPTPTREEHDVVEDVPASSNLFDRFRIGRRRPSGDGVDARSSRMRSRMRVGRSASETDVADSFLEETGPSSSAGGQEGDDEEPMEHLLDETASGEGEGHGDVEAGGSGITVRTQPQSGWATELDTDALADRLGQIAGWERVRRLFGFGGSAGR
ncbi:hypothetical protein A4X13_0g2541 [Tilletia indica]|uniref:Uncharacterized protein n=1 Tax=Tilletia indica TaxID=43049 RepID=A0A177TXE1_9BASI|nr:hypothetical protein A4X13_0g2541 [Tilletia indica]